MKTALAENPFLPDPGERGGDYRGGQRVNGSTGKGTTDQGPIDQLEQGTIDQGTNAPLNYSQSNSGGSLEPIEPIDKLPIDPLPMEPKDQETWQILIGIVAKCKKNVEENKEKFLEMAPDPEQRFPTEERLPNGNIWLMDKDTGEKWGLLYKDPRDGLEYVKLIKWEGKNLTARERQLYLR